MRRFALYSDIHGNAAALEAVLADIAADGIEERYCLGDLVGYGPEPAAVIELVRATGDPVIRGNYDDGVGGRKGSCGCHYGTPEAKADGEESYRFTDAALDDAEHAYLTGLLDEVRFEAEGVRVLLCHGSPRRINEYLMPDRPDWHLAKLAEAADADLICFGHVHLPYDRPVELADGRVARFVSDGSVGKPKDGDTRACWAEVVIGGEAAEGAGAPETLGASAESAGASPTGAADAGTPAIEVIFHRVAYDVESVAASILAAGLPERIADALRSA